jgi:hypothetical protein
MALSGKGKIIQPSKGKIVIYIPSKVHNDSMFPFKPRQNVEVIIDGNKLIIRASK